MFGGVRYAAPHSSHAVFLILLQIVGSKAELGEDLFMGDALVVLELLARCVAGAGFFFADRLVVERKGQAVGMSGSCDG